MWPSVSPLYLLNIPGDGRTPGRIETPISHICRIMQTDPRALYWERKDRVEGSNIGAGRAKKGGDEDPRDG